MATNLSKKAQRKLAQELQTLQRQENEKKEEQLGEGDKQTEQDNPQTDPEFETSEPQEDAQQEEQLQINEQRYGGDAPITPGPKKPEAFLELGETESEGDDSEDKTESEEIDPKDKGTTYSIPANLTVYNYCKTLLDVLRDTDTGEDKESMRPVLPPEQERLRTGGSGGNANGVQRKTCFRSLIRRRMLPRRMLVFLSVTRIITLSRGQRSWVLLLYEESLGMFSHLPQLLMNT